LLKPRCVVVRHPIMMPELVGANDRICRG
jgi:hypothetical protein